MDLASYLGGLEEEVLERAAIAEERAEKGDSSYEKDDIRWFKLDQPEKKGQKVAYGMFLLKFQPKDSPRAALFRLRYQHFALPTSETDTIIRTCMSKSKPKEHIVCPFCDLVNGLKEQARTKEERQAFFRFEARGQAMVNVIPTMILGRRPDYSQNEGLDGKTAYLPYIARFPERIYDKASTFLTRNNFGPLDPNAASQLVIEIEKTGEKKWNVKYDANFGYERGQIASNAEHLQYLLERTYDLSLIFRDPTPEEYQKQFEEAAQVAAILRARSVNRTAVAPGAATGGYAAPGGYAPPPAYAAVPPQAPVAAPQYAGAAPAPAPAPAPVAAPSYVPPTAFTPPTAQAPEPAPVAVPAPAPAATGFTPPSGGGTWQAPQATTSTSPTGTGATTAQGVTPSAPASPTAPVVAFTPPAGPASSTPSNVMAPPPPPAYVPPAQHIAPTYTAPVAPTAAPTIPVAPAPVSTVAGAQVGGGHSMEPGGSGTFRQG